MLVSVLQSRKNLATLSKEIILEAYQEKMREYIMKRPEDLEKEKEESVNEPEMNITLVRGFVFRSLHI